MAIQSFRVTKKELQTYYIPKVSDYELMVNSINSTMGYGQIIQRYLDDNILNTYLHVYSLSNGAEIVYDKTSGQQSSVETAGPTFWGVSSEIGMEFLNGITDIEGLRKLKYCDGCIDGNGLDKPVVDNFSKRFRKVEELVLAYGLLEGFLFYDYSLPKYSDVFPAIKRDDGINVTYQFKNVNTGADLTVEDVALITDTPVVAIKASITTAPVVKPQEGANTVITSCCDETIFYVISGQYTIGNILYTDSVTDSFCWYVESLTDSDPTLPDSFTFISGGRSCEACVKLNPCPAVCEGIQLTNSTELPIDCFGLTTTYLIDWNTGILYNDGECGYTSPAYGYYGDGKFVYSWDGTFSEYGTCSRDTSSSVTPCCPVVKRGIIEGVYPIGTVVFTKDTDLLTCFVVTGNSFDQPTFPYKFQTYDGDCDGCTGGC